MGHRNWRSAAESAFAIIGAAFFGAALALPVTAGANDLIKQDRELIARIERRIVKEPKYNSSPRYLLLALGPKAETKVWLVEDGKSLYVDKNANGDLTDDGRPLSPSDYREFQRTPDAKSWDYEYDLGAVTPADGSKHTEFRLRRWNYGDKKDQYGLSLTLNGKVPMYAGWSLDWGNSPQSAPVIHFGGPLKPRILRRGQFTIGEGESRLSLCFINPGLGPSAASLLSINAIPTNAVPKLDVVWPVAAGAAPLHMSYLLKDRCCYWEFYHPDFKTPAGAVAGTAKIKVVMPPGALPLVLATDTLKFPVREPPSAKPAN